MEDLSDLVKGLNIKSRQLSLKHKTLKNDFEKLQKKQIETENSLTQQKQTILELENKYKY